MLLCPFLLEESEGRHQRSSDVDETGGGQGDSVVVASENRSTGWLSCSGWEGDQGM